MMINRNKNILISGASIAGPTLAYWLKRYGFTPTVIERAPQLREGGYPVDVRFEAVQVAKLMGIWPRLQQEKTTIEEMSFVNERNQRISRVNIQAVPKALGVDVVEIMRGDLARTLYELTKDEVEYCFGDSIQALKQDEEGVDVTFERGGSRRFDLLVGADGLHSIVRTLVFGDEAQFERYFGYQVGVFTTTTIWDWARPPYRCMVCLENWSRYAVHEATRSWPRFSCSSNPRSYAMITMMWRSTSNCWLRRLPAKAGKSHDSWRKCTRPLICTLIL